MNSNTIYGPELSKDILDFINRRFPIDKDCNWMSGNCYYFARVLKARFKGEIWYDLINGHFLFRRGDYFFDWTGIRLEYDLNKPETMNGMVKWSTYKKIDPAHYERIVRDVIE